MAKQRKWILAGASLAVVAGASVATLGHAPRSPAFWSGVSIGLGLVLIAALAIGVRRRL